MSDEDITEYEDKDAGSYWATSPAEHQRLVNNWANKMGYHKATQETIPLHRDLRNDFIHLAEMILRQVPPGRERTISLGRLQEALMWANAGIAINLAPIAHDD